MEDIGFQSEEVLNELLQMAKLFDPTAYRRPWKYKPNKNIPAADLYYGSSKKPDVRDRSEITVAKKTIYWWIGIRSPLFLSYKRQVIDRKDDAWRKHENEEHRIVFTSMEDVRDFVKDCMESSPEETSSQFDVKENNSVTKELDVSKNTILYGPPGTGKTYHTVIYAVAICEEKSIDDVENEDYGDVLKRFNEYKSDGRIAFTTFHQSYGYEEFIEGIKPITDEETGTISYEIIDGVFKEFCEKAELPLDEEINHNADVFIVRLNLKGNGKDDLKKECFRDGEIRFDWPEDGSDRWMRWFSAMKPGDYVLSYYDKARNIDGIGVVLDEEPFYDQSKMSFRWTRKVNWLVKDRIIDILAANNGKYISKSHVGRVPNMKLSSLLELAGEKGTHDISVFENAWEKLIKAAEDNGNKYTFTRRSGSPLEANYMGDDKFRVEWSGGTYNDLAKSAIMNQWTDTSIKREDLPKGGTLWLYDAYRAVLDEMQRYGLLPYSVKKDEPCVFVIDEINRGNISKIFGELITLIEDTKRAGGEEEMSATLPYSHQTFSIPSKVYILGTMNTADRSIALMDTALRRRFSFEEMMPDEEILKDIVIEAEGISLNIGKMLLAINRRVEFLYDREHTLGHAYFLTLRSEPTLEKLAAIFKNKVIPLLQEYFYEDYEKIRMILGDDGKEEAYQFIKKISIRPTDVFKGRSYDMDESYVYRINDDAFGKIASYVELI